MNDESKGEMDGWVNKLINKWVSKWRMSKTTSEETILKYSVRGLAQFLVIPSASQFRLFTAQNLAVSEFYFLCVLLFLYGEVKIRYRLEELVMIWVLILLM